MDFRSKNRSLYESLGIHALLGAAVLFLYLLNRLPLRQTIDISVIEVPRLSPRAIEIAKPKIPEKKPPKQRQVFGESRKAITSAESIEVKQGNTIAKAVDNEKLNANDATSLPIPSDEYLVTQMPELKTAVRVPYPAESKKKRLEGVVLMDLLIDAIGQVREVALISGPSTDLNEAAVNAAHLFAFKPALIQDKPVAVRIRYAYRFVLEQ